MEYIKIQERIIKSWSKRERIMVQSVDDSIHITDNSHQVFTIPKEKFILDMSVLLDGNEPMNFKRIIDGIEGEDGVLSGDMKVIDNLTALKITSENNHSWVDKKLLDKFGIKKGLHFTVPPKPTHPLLVWEGEVLCGLILPVRVKDDE